ncbi:MAG: RNA polymerase-binding protein DksA [Deltaproteobacteria bacterium]|jgi:DnaK suppressor protein|nr:RNA polymerase-binding protein DksA [Deltaproteobacteria bacterium]
MDKDLLERFRALLLAQREEIMSHAASTVNDLLVQAESFPDPADRATLETDRSFTLRLRERERHLLNKIDEALERISDGSFGICENCGDDISIARLEARPVSTLCISCKTAQEEQEARRG